jgi:hypothetical protein
MRTVRLVGLLAMPALLVGCGLAGPPERPAKPVVAEVTIHVPEMT